MKTAINAMCVVAGTALLGRSGDMFPTLQGKVRVGVTLAISDMGASAGGFDSPLAPPLSHADKRKTGELRSTGHSSCVMADIIG